jgi:hypothetical protein
MKAPESFFVNDSGIESTDIHSLEFLLSGEITLNEELLIGFKSIQRKESV